MLQLILLAAALVGRFGNPALAIPCNKQATEGTTSPSITPNNPDHVLQNASSASNNVYQALILSPAFRDIVTNKGKSPQGIWYVSSNVTSVIYPLDEISIEEITKSNTTQVPLNPAPVSTYPPPTSSGPTKNVEAPHEIVVHLVNDGEASTTTDTKRVGCSEAPTTAIPVTTPGTLSPCEAAKIKPLLTNTSSTNTNTTTTPTTSPTTSSTTTTPKTTTTTTTTTTSPTTTPTTTTPKTTTTTTTTTTSPTTTPTTTTPKTTTTTTTPTTTSPTTTPTTTTPKTTTTTTTPTTTTTTTSPTTTPTTTTPKTTTTTTTPTTTSPTTTPTTTTPKTTTTTTTTTTSPTTTLTTTTPKTTTTTTTPTTTTTTTTTPTTTTPKTTTTTTTTTTSPTTTSPTTTTLKTTTTTTSPTTTSPTTTTPTSTTTPKTTTTTAATSSTTTTTTLPTTHVTSESTTTRPDVIVKGREVDISQFPYQLSYEYRGGHYCSASIISEYWALTLGQCTTSENPPYLVHAAKEVRLRSGSTSRLRGGHIHQAVYITMTKRKNNGSFKNDIAVIRVATPFNVNRIVPLADWQPAQHAMANLSGWGFRNSSSSYKPYYLRAVELPVIGRDECIRQYKQLEMIDQISETSFCAGWSTGGEDSCQSDLGSPLVINGVQAGILAKGPRCGSRLPTVYTDISVLRMWIEQRISLVDAQPE